LDRDLDPRVVAHAGYSGSDYPQIVRWQGSELIVTNIIKEWREPGCKHYLVETGNGMHFKLTLEETSAQWRISPVRIKTKVKG
jgi:hypothetical protein